MIKERRDILGNLALSLKDDPSLPELSLQGTRPPALRSSMAYLCILH